MNARTTFLLAGLCLGLGACDSGPETGPTPVRRAVQLQVLTGVPLHVTCGELLEPRTVRAVDSLGAPFANAHIRWQVVAGGGSLLLTDTLSDESGLAHVVWRLGSKPITNRIEASLQGTSVVVPFETEAVVGPPARVAITPPFGTISFNPNSPATTFTLIPAVFDRCGNELLGQVIHWSSSNPAVAEVNQNGVVTSRAAGEVTITATAGSGSGTAKLTVNPQT
jgi:hypothetical protein